MWKKKKKKRKMTHFMAQTTHLHRLGPFRSPLPFRKACSFKNIGSTCI